MSTPWWFIVAILAALAGLALYCRHIYLHHVKDVGDDESDRMSPQMWQQFSTAAAASSPGCVMCALERTRRTDTAS